MQTKKLIETFHAQVRVHYFPIGLQVFLAMLIGNFICSPSEFLVFDGRYEEPRFYLHWFLSSLITMGVLYGAQVFTSYMDRSLCWLTDFRPRLIGQIGYGMLLPALLANMLVFLLFLQLTSMNMEVIGQYMRYKFGFVVLFLFILNLLFLLIYLIRFARFVKDQYVEVEMEKTVLKEMLTDYQEMQLTLEDERLEDFSDAVMLATCLRVKYGYDDHYVPLDGIAFIKSSADEKKLLTLNSNKEYTHDYSLDALMKVLDKDQYYLMYRRYIVNRSTIKGYVTLDNGRLSIELKPQFEQPHQVLVSRQDAADFRHWFDWE